MVAAETAEFPSHLSRDHALDREVAATATVDAPWARAAALPIFGVLGIVVAVSVIVAVAGLPLSDSYSAAYGFIGESLLGVFVFFCCRPVARQCGGWRRAFGFSLPAHGEGRSILGWFAIQLAARFIVAAVLVSAVPYLRDRHVGNLNNVDHLGTLGAALLLVAGVAVAPVIEELAMRGALLRALMRRLAFWPAAVVSSVVFGGLHAFTVTSWAALIVTVPVIAVFGLLQCLLVRRTGRLGPAIGVHATTNLFAIALVLLSAPS